MRYDEFLAKVRERGEYGSQQEAAQVTAAVLGVLSSRITPGEAASLAAQLPKQLHECIDSDPDRATATFGVEEFCRRVADQVGARPGTAQWDASAVLSTLAEAVSGGELNHLFT
ncbi:uncharacterized protein (DUF2267 family) [Thermocatellispora tengchongensis]|uniref:Uncharacterized protein (DUF2267 family) n=1 Tax=Thermocatellispora tengchongensis TaxID=1073253 RepID=A0A840PEG6_9ACTN|nr:DUF2267 domain-containing protein [Thermocatellispora tengchongensis]MBB5137146.1 uncharacterized protein (DUF2267 family) [Thermocatellispora tengchongensis]